ncbi:MAG: enoyl-CoA hydratase/isomerase family protein [Caulobacter sp.]|nr:enoyl-CoA hydratase/isomerase family protein [Caulobacter sp.]
MSASAENLPWLDVADIAAARLSMDDFGPGTGRPWVAIDAREGRDQDLPQHAPWLATLPCPVVVLSGNDGDRPAGCDAVVDQPELLTAIAASVAAAPLAAMTFVQVLRIIEHLPSDEALTAESLAYGVLQSGPEFRAWRDRSAAPAAPAAEPGPAVILERKGDRLQLTLNRSSNRNALSMDMRNALVEALDLGSLDHSITEVTLRGAGKCFSVGGDLTEFGLLSDPASAHWVRSLRSPARSALRCGPKLHARVHGACIGAGVELPAFAHRVTAAANSFFQLPELKMGLLPGSGGCVSLSRRIGRHRTALLGLTGRRINAATALAWGLVDDIAD